MNISQVVQKWVGHRGLAAASGLYTSSAELSGVTIKGSNFGQMLSLQ